MWAQVVMIMLGIWLFTSPFFFQNGRTLSPSYLTDFIFGSLIVTFGFFNCFYKNRLLSVLLAAVAVWCFFNGYLGYEHPRPPFAQNQIVVGLLLLMFVVIPPDDKALHYEKSI